MVSYTLAEMGEMSDRIVKWIDNYKGTLPVFVNTSQGKLSMADYLYLAASMTLVLYEGLNKVTPTLSLPRNFGNPGSNRKTITKGNVDYNTYVAMARDIVQFMNNKGFALEYSGISVLGGYVSFEALIYMYARNLQYWWDPAKGNQTKQAQYMPFIDLFVTQSVSTKTDLHKQIEAAVGGEYKTATELYNLVKANEKYEYYYNDIYPQGQAIQRLANNQGLNCSDFSQIGMAAIVEMNKGLNTGYSANYLNVACKPSGAGHVLLQVKGGEFGNSYVYYDLAEAASGGGAIGSSMCVNGFTVKATNPDWLVSDDGQ